MTTKRSVNTSEDPELWTLLGQARELKAPKGFAANIMQKIEENPSQIVYPCFSWGKRVSALAACVACICVVSWALIPDASDNMQNGIVATEIEDDLLYAEAVAEIGADWENAIASVIDNDGALLQQDESAVFVM